MKASELIRRLQGKISEVGDLDVEFHCHPQVSRYHEFRPVELVHDALKFPEGTNTLVLTTSPEWRQDK